jgi:hypothetical protein
MEATTSLTPTPCGYNGESCGSSSVSDCWKGLPSLCPGLYTVMEIVSPIQVEYSIIHEI